jgi:hypothetical protein
VQRFLKPQTVHALLDSGGNPKTKIPYTFFQLFFGFCIFAPKNVKSHFSERIVPSQNRSLWV